MVGDQKMEVGNGAVANQAKGNIENHYHGMSFADVERIVNLLFDANFPKLLADARETIEQRLGDITKQLFKLLEEHKEEIDAQRFAEPNVQFQLQQMTKVAAQKGEKSNFELLCDVFILNLKKDTSDLTELVANEALELLPKLSARHVEFLALYVFVRKVNIPDATFDHVEEFCRVFLENTSLSVDITERDRTYMAGVGAFQMANMSHMEMIPEFLKQLDDIKKLSPVNVRRYLEEKKFTSTLAVFSLSNDSRTTRCVISEAGTMIGWIGLSKFFPVDLSTVLETS